MENNFKLCPVAFHAAKPAIEKLVRKLNLEVYGGDAVINSDGKISVIDINDWPSFAYFRDEASSVIGNYIHNRLNAFMSNAVSHFDQVQKRQ